MVDRLLHIITKRMVLDYMEGVNIDGLSDEFGNSLFILYQKKEVYICNASLSEYLNYLGIPEDIYNKYRREIIRGMIKSSKIHPNDNSIIMLMRSGNYILDDENKIDEFSYICLTKI